jgi:hypothetical protein
MRRVRAIARPRLAFCLAGAMPDTKILDRVEGHRASPAGFGTKTNVAEAGDPIVKRLALYLEHDPVAACKGLRIAPAWFRTAERAIRPRNRTCKQHAAPLAVDPTVSHTIFNNAVENLWWNRCHRAILLLSIIDYTIAETKERGLHGYCVSTQHAGRLWSLGR